MVSECRVSIRLMVNWKKNHTNSLHLQATWERVKNTWFNQFKQQQNSILKILLCHVTQQIGRDRFEAAIDTDTVSNPYADRLNDLPITKTHNKSTLKTSSFINPTWQILSSFNQFFDNLISSDTEECEEVTSP